MNSIEPWNAWWSFLGIAGVSLGLGLLQWRLSRNYWRASPEGIQHRRGVVAMVVVMAAALTLSHLALLALSPWWPRLVAWHISGGVIGLLGVLSGAASGLSLLVVEDRGSATLAADGATTARRTPLWQKAAVGVLPGLILATYWALNVALIRGRTGAFIDLPFAVYTAVMVVFPRWHSLGGKLKTPGIESLKSQDPGGVPAVMDTLIAGAGRHRSALVSHLILLLPRLSDVSLLASRHWSYLETILRRLKPSSPEPDQRLAAAVIEFAGWVGDERFLSQLRRLTVFPDSGGSGESIPVAAAHAMERILNRTRVLDAVHVAEP